MRADTSRLYVFFTLSAPQECTSMSRKMTGSWMDWYFKVRAILGDLVKCLRYEEGGSQFFILVQ